MLNTQGRSMKPAAKPAPKFRGASVDVVVDVRSKIEFWLGHLPGAECIPVDQMPDAIVERDDLTQSARILVYCASGARSAAAAARLRAAGYGNVVDGGGITAASEHFTPSAR
jgi:rhodanese-related sulfurtransferase